jgi:hypothetical protein
VAASKNSRPFEAICSKKDTMRGKIFEAEMTVRDSELDQHGFVKPLPVLPLSTPSNLIALPSPTPQNLNSNLVTTPINPPPISQRGESGPTTARTTPASATTSLCDRAPPPPSLPLGQPTAGAGRTDTLKIARSRWIVSVLAEWRSQAGVMS